jgi:hypothetical protein
VRSDFFFPEEEEAEAERAILSRLIGVQATGSP